MAEPYEDLRESAQNNDNERTGQEWHELITKTYHVPLKASTFAPFIKDSYNNANWLACHVMEWVLDWFRPTSDGQPRIQGGRLNFPSSWLAENEFYVSPDKLKTARLAICRSGFITFHSQRHTCWAEVHWEAIEQAISLSQQCSKVERFADFRQGESAPSKSRQGESAPSKSLRQGESAPSNVLDGVNSPHKPPLYSSFNSSSLKGDPGGSKEEDVEKSGEEAARHPSWSDTELSAMANELIEYGIKHGRPCSGPWADRSREAFADVVRDGHDPKVVGSAWKAYLATFGDDAKRASDLGHWLRSVDLRGQPVDYGDRGFDAVYAAEALKARREASRRAVETGEGLPEPTFTFFNDGDARGIIVSVAGTGMSWSYDAVPPTASRADCEAAFPAWWATIVERGLNKEQNRR